jgi:hypothetical protein
MDSVIPQRPTLGEGLLARARRCYVRARMRPLPFALLVGAVVSGCGPAAPPPIALENRVFYPGEDQAAASSASGAIERPYPPLDRNAEGDLPAYIGVSILGGTVHLSRPANWKIRRASLVPEKRYVEYVSPNEYLFAIYERVDSPVDRWSDVLGRYQKDVKAKGAEIVGERIPVATWNAQGREFIVRRTVKGQRAPYSHLSSEVLLRGEHRIELVQIVHQGESIAPVGGELLRVMETLELR